MLFIHECTYIKILFFRYRKKQKDKIREIKKIRKERQKEIENRDPPTLTQDDRFKDVDAERFKKNKKHSSNPVLSSSNDFVKGTTQKKKNKADKRFKTALPNQKSKKLLIGKKIKMK